MPFLVFLTGAAIGTVFMSFVLTSLWLYAHITIGWIP